MDTSAQGRMELWGFAIEMAKDHPFGIGADNYKKYVATYGSTGQITDTHSTYLKFLAEFGIQGFVVFILLILNSYRILFKINKDLAANNINNDFKIISYCLIITLTSYYISCIFMSANFVENLYWILMWPVFLKRAYLKAKEAHNDGTSQVVNNHLKPEFS